MGRADKLSKRSCKLDDVSLMVEALESAARPTTSSNVQDILRNSLLKCVELQSIKVLKYLIDQGADVKAITPSYIVSNMAEGAVSEQKTIEILECLVAHGWDINAIGIPQRNDLPILWHVCNYPALVQWCLDHGSHLEISGETTSTNAEKAEVYHTPRHPLLLEHVAEFGSIPTFRMLLERGAPLAPGETWPVVQAPQILHRAIFAAIHASPITNTTASSDYLKRLEMIKYLLGEIGLDINGRRPFKSSHILFLNVGRKSSFNLLSGETGRELEELVKTLLLAGAKWEISENQEASGYDLVTPLNCINRWDGVQFRYAESRCHRHQAIRNLWITRNATVAQIPNLELSRFPNEILHEIGVHLDLASIRSIRLTSHAMSRAMNRAFRLFFRRKTILLQPEDLEKANEQLMIGGPMRFLEEAIFTWIQCRDSQTQESIQNLLTTFLKNASTHGRLHSLDLGGSFHSSSDHVCLGIVLSAICKSGIALKSFSLYAAVGRYAACVDIYTNFAQLRALSASVKRLTHFNWTLTMLGQLPGANRDWRTKVPGHLNLETIKQILDMMPQLRSLELLWFRKAPARPGRTPESLFFDTCYASVLAMENLANCSLSGIDAQEDSLHRFLAQTSARRITLREFRLMSGDWRSILDILTSGSFSYFHLDDLYESKHLLCFDVSGLQKLVTGCADDGTSEVIREGRETRDKLDYRRIGHIYDLIGNRKYEEARLKTYGSDWLREFPGWGHQ